MAQASEPCDSRLDQLEQFTHTDNGVIAVDARQRIILWNKPAEALLEYRAEEVLGRCCYAILRTTDECGTLVCCRSCAQFEQARKRHWSTHQFFAARRKSGERRWLQVLTFGLLSPDQELSFLVHVFWDAGQSPKRSDAQLHPPPPEPTPWLF